VFVLVAPVTAFGDDYPTSPDKKDQLCEIVPETPSIAVPPRDRLWFQEHCVCEDMRVGCGAPNSARYYRRIRAVLTAERKRRMAEAAAEKKRLREAEAAYLKEQAEQAEAEKNRAPAVAAGRRATSELRRAYWACATPLGEKQNAAPDLKLDVDSHRKASAAPSAKLSAGKDPKPDDLKLRDLKLPEVKLRDIEPSAVTHPRGAADPKVSTVDSPVAKEDEACAVPANELEAACAMHGLRIRDDESDECYVEEFAVPQLSNAEASWVRRACKELETRPAPNGRCYECGAQLTAQSRGRRPGCDATNTACRTRILRTIKANIRQCLADRDRAL
jgi:hypothetical protein